MIGERFEHPAFRGERDGRGLMRFLLLLLLPLFLCVVLFIGVDYVITGQIHLIMIWCFGAYTVFVLVLEYLYLNKIAKQRQRQLASLVDAIPEEHTGEFSSGDIYADIHESLLEFRHQTNDVRQNLKSRTLHNLLHGHSREISKELLKAAGVLPSAQAYYVAAFHIDDLSNLSPGGGRPDTNELARVIIRSALLSLSEDKVGFTSCASSGGVDMVFSAISAERFRETVEEICGSAVKLMVESYHISAQVTMSAPVTDPVKLPEAYQETQKLRNFAKSVNSDVPLISQEDMQGDGGGALLNGDFIRKEQILLNTLLAGKYSVVPSMAAAILAEHVSCLRQNYSLAQGRLVSIANVLSEGVLAANLPGLAVAEEAERLRKADSVLKLNEETERVYGQMAELMDSGAVGNDTVARACEFIHSHVDNPNLNVSAVCESVGISVQRLTRMFQAKFDMAIAEYMNSYRVGWAKELLEDKSLTVVQIAAKVGYNNTDTLTRNFRKLEGVTPSEYRKLLP